MKNLQIIRSGVLGTFDTPPQFFTISWRITGKCPYKCSYCYERNWPSRSVEPELRALQTAMARLKPILASHMDKQMQLNFRLFGGEPLAHSQFLLLLADLRNHFPTAKFGCQSNGYRPISFFREILSIDPN